MIDLKFVLLFVAYACLHNLATCRPDNEDHPVWGPGAGEINSLPDPPHRDLHDEEDDDEEQQQDDVTGIYGDITAGGEEGETYAPMVIGHPHRPHFNISFPELLNMIWTYWGIELNVTYEQIVAFEKKLNYNSTDDDYQNRPFDQDAKAVNCGLPGNYCGSNEDCCSKMCKVNLFGSNVNVCATI